MRSGVRGGGQEKPLGGSSWLSKLWAAEKRSPARKPLRRCPHYITDIPATEPASLMRGAARNAEQDEEPSGRPQSRQSRSSPQRPAGRAGPEGDAGAHARGSRWTRGGGGPPRGPGEGAGGRGVKCVISCRAVVPDSLPSARGSV